MHGMFVDVRNFWTVYTYSTIKRSDMFDWNILWLEILLEFIDMFYSGYL